MKPNKIFTIFVILVFAVIVSVMFLFRTSQHKTMHHPVVVKQSSVDYGLLGAVDFTNEVYNLYLQNWDQGEANYINRHSSWFSDRLGALAKQSKNQELLFCQEPSSKPDKFIATASQLNPNSFATVYINGYHGKKTVVKDLLIKLTVTNGIWVIDGPNCILD